MARTAEDLIVSLASELHSSREAVIEESLHLYLEKQLRQVKADILQITGKYGVASAEEMEARYRQGALEEAETWPDLQRLDHLEYKRERLSQLLSEIG